jgi:hypothetical protein
MSDPAVSAHFCTEESRHEWNYRTFFLHRSIPLYRLSIKENHSSRSSGCSNSSSLGPQANCNDIIVQLETTLCTDAKEQKKWQQRVTSSDWLQKQNINGRNYSLLLFYLSLFCGPLSICHIM